ncbi:hypothetical protein MTR67_018689 [Solanum verrucosum]|uniref:Uncharacterized protein n=1 Tax=Solanum verrucosum TaxID=315347 RepID=A0AAF0QK49_SOLVR|nr:hypothetical protein MTR67_018689 [Solanum verrucosum]
MNNPSKLHPGAAKRVLRYIAGTTYHGIWYSKVTNFTLIGFTDNDYVGNIDDRKRTYGFLFNVGSEAVSWSSNKQELVALYTLKDEYIVATFAACQEVWLRRLASDFNQKPTGATEIFCDNRSSIAMSKNKAFHSRTKDIYIHYHIIRSLVSTGEVTLKSCDIIELATYIFTKLLPQANHEFFRGQLVVCSFESRGGG